MFSGLSSKMTIVLVCFALIGRGVCFAQEGAVHLPAGTFSVEELIRETEKQTRYLFVYGNETFDIGRRLTVNAGESKVSDVLGLITGDKWRYDIRQRYIVISVAELPKEPAMPDIFLIPPGFEEKEAIPDKGTEFPVKVTPSSRKKNNIRPVIVNPGL